MLKTFSFLLCLFISLTIQSQSSKVVWPFPDTEDDMVRWFDVPRTAWVDGQDELIFQEFPDDSLTSPQQGFNHRGRFLHGADLTTHLMFADMDRHNEIFHKLTQHLMRVAWISSTPAELAITLSRMGTSLLAPILPPPSRNANSILDILLSKTPQFGLTIMAVDEFIQCDKGHHNHLDTFDQVTHIDIPEDFPRTNDNPPKTFQEQVNALFNPYQPTDRPMCEHCGGFYHRQNLAMDHRLPHRLVTGPSFARHDADIDDIFEPVTVRASEYYHHGERQRGKEMSAPYHLFCLVTLDPGSEDHCKTGVAQELVKGKRSVVVAVYSRVEGVVQGSVEDVGMEDISDEAWQAQVEENK
ncbi:hypothetical protein KVT40_003033 [Elsinoe batatas]|uniref:C2H2-type domain-containing protein n=1 Tax=Elsinoe batatas TaxID=2601811 RepID=A0A8K0LBF4_9PEZI|nr:hypothetical protein KVT40_003033 [Elsinoe batatas]